MEELLYGNLFAIVGPNLELWGKGITSPEAGPVYSIEWHNTDETERAYAKVAAASFW